MEQTINILTERERQLDDIDQAIRETEYPPLNGGPTIQDLAGLLKGAAATIEELGDQVDERDESNWRFARKRAANEIDRAVQRIRDIYQHSFMVDQTQVMTKHGKEAFDVEAYDNHEDDARRWNLCLFHHMDGCWQDEAQEARVLKFYEDQPHIGIFEPKDFRHFAKRQ